MISGGAAGGISESTDGGDSWKKLSGGMPTGIVGIIGVSPPPIPIAFWATIEAEPNEGVYRSDDAGKTWTRTNSGNNLRQRAWYYTRIWINPTNRNLIILGDDGGGVVSLNRGRGQLQQIIDRELVEAAENSMMCASLRFLRPLCNFGR
jgi:photosystem II stability/assembly factor-like uncharacterized protein